MREATALVRRVELILPSGSEPAVVGMRRDGELSIFIGPDPVFQFNNKRQLRRGFWNGQLVKAECGRLVTLDRRRTETEVQLVRNELTEAQTSEFVELASNTVHLLQRVLCTDQSAVLRRIPDSADTTTEIAEMLASLPAKPHIASSAGI